MTKKRDKWKIYTDRFFFGEWRATIFHDLILKDIECLKQKKNDMSLLDIGCGGGFDNDPLLQRSLSQAAVKYVGIEPNLQIPLQNIFTKVYQSSFEDSAIEAGSIDIAFSVMVLEHIRKPDVFWKKIHFVLKNGGVFWGFTMDARHPFAIFSNIMEKIHIKDWYLTSLHGDKGKNRYENYKVYYKTNSPNEIVKFTKSFSKIEFLDFFKIGQLDFYFPEPLKWIGRSYDKISRVLKWPNSMMIVRLEK